MAKKRQSKKARREKRKERVKKYGIKLLAPFRRAMERELQRRNIAYEKNLADVAKKFYEGVIKGKESFEYEHAVDPVTISVIVSAILAFFKGLKDKKKEGKEMKEWEKDMADVAEKVDEAVTEEKKKEFLAQPTTLIMLGLALLVVFMIFRK